MVSEAALTQEGGGRCGNFGIGKVRKELSFLVGKTRMEPWFVLPWSRLMVAPAEAQVLADGQDGTGHYCSFLFVSLLCFSLVFNIFYDFSLIS